MQQRRGLTGVKRIDFEKGEVELEAVVRVVDGSYVIEIPREVVNILNIHGGSKLRVKIYLQPREELTLEEMIRIVSERVAEEVRRTIEEVLEARKREVQAPAPEFKAATEVSTPPSREVEPVPPSKHELGRVLSLALDVIRYHIDAFASGRKRRSISWPIHDSDMLLDRKVLYIVLKELNIEDKARVRVFTGSRGRKYIKIELPPDIDPKTVLEKLEAARKRIEELIRYAEHGLGKGIEDAIRLLQIAIDELERNPNIIVAQIKRDRVLSENIDLEAAASVLSEHNVYIGEAPGDTIELRTPEDGDKEATIRYLREVLRSLLKQKQASSS